ncbi:TPA: hypothetical protein DIC38_01775 [Candidatus Nomurabacteria bacterium]|nr:MAG: hypothetical protein O210_OD1C00001G0378 [Parcubacteria bacterium RAAC4_OD1_1]HCY26389.1 hypothetical protein [Candidatus Nomurabacteria bacterium]
MDIKDLDKKQLILLTLLITFIVSIATGIITVSLMNQMPKSVPYTVNNVIQRTIEKVTTVTEPSKEENISTSNEQPKNSLISSGDVLIKIYKDEILENNILGEGVLISDTGLILVDENILNGDEKYFIVLGEIEFDASVVKKYDNGFAILSIKEKSEIEEEKSTQPENTDTIIQSENKEN